MQQCKHVRPALNLYACVPQIVCEPSEPTHKLAQRCPGKALHRRSAYAKYAEFACKCLADKHRAAAAAHVVSGRSLPVAQRIEVLKEAVAG